MYDEDAVSRDSQINIEANFFHMISMGGFRSRLCYLGFTSAKADLADLTVLCGSPKNYAKSVNNQIVMILTIIAIR